MKKRYVSFKSDSSISVKIDPAPFSKERDRLFFEILYQTTWDWECSMILI